MTAEKSPFSPREIEFLQIVAKGYSVMQLAKLYRVRTHTMELMLYGLREKLGQVSLTCNLR